MASAITIVGLGTGDPEGISLRAWHALEEAGRIYLRTERHPAVERLRERGLAFEALDGIYEQHDDFPSVYAAIADKLLRAAEGGAVVYAVPGHPTVAERTAGLLREACPEKGIALTLVSGQSFLDEAFLRLGLDPIDGFQLLDATSLKADQVRADMHTIIAQVYDVLTASEVKLTLMDVFPDDYPVVAAHALGVPGEEIIERLPLFELDRTPAFGNLSLVYVPASADDRLRNRTFARLKEVVAILRAPGGCPWDREQTHASLRKNLIEEAYEVLETIDDDDPDAMREELGDLLLQVMMHAQIEEEAGVFRVEDVLQEINEKLVRRHPHVFGEREAGDAEEALRNWQAVKDEEKKSKGRGPAEESALQGVPRDLPALMKAVKLQKKAAAVGFDWERIDEVVAKVREELAELLEAVHRGESKERQLDELGDLLFAAANLSRFLKIDPEEALHSTNRKFVSRFRHIEARLREAGRSLADADLAEMERYWQEAKNK